MSFLASIYAIAPQQISIVGGSTAAIPVTVDPNYSRITILGWSGIAGGVVTGNRFRVSFSSGSLLTSVGSGSAIVVVEYFKPRLFRQPFQHSTVTIPVSGTSVSGAHGLTLGSKAFIVHNGQTSARVASPGSGLALQETQVLAQLSLAGANVAASCGTAPYSDGNGTIVVNYTLIDPK